MGREPKAKGQIDQRSEASRRPLEREGAVSYQQPQTHATGIDRNDATTTDSVATRGVPSLGLTSGGSRLSKLSRRIVHALPTIVILFVLAGLGYWGHHSGWSLPRFSELTGRAVRSDANWCDEHGVPASICIACNPELMPKQELLGWCQEHGVAECVLDHPERAELREQPAISPADLEQAQRALALKERPKNNPVCKLHLRRIQFASREAADKAGIDIALVDRGSVVEALHVNGEIIYDPTCVARLSSRTPGTVWRVARNVGDRVSTGDVLALVDAAEVGRAKAELLEAAARRELHHQNYRRLASLEGVVPGRHVLEAETSRIESEIAVRKAIQTLVNLGLFITFEEACKTSTEELRQRVQILGLPRKLVGNLDTAQITSNLMPIVAPREGIVETRDVVAGEFVDTTRTLFTVVDTSRMWLTMNVPIEQIKHVAFGQKVIFQPDGQARHEGTVTWISTAVDMETRTVQVRAELPNENGHLRDETFGRGRIVLREEEAAILVPNEAIHWEGCCHVAFVRDRNYMEQDSYRVFHARMVRPGVQSGDNTEMIAGLLPGEVVATKGSGILRAELLKGNLGPGDCANNKQPVGCDAIAPRVIRAPGRSAGV